jgi:hypothetical protein
VGHRIHYSLCHPPVSRSYLRNRICEVAQSFTNLPNRLEVRGRPRYRFLNPGTQPTKGPLLFLDTGLNTPGPTSRNQTQGGGYGGQTILRSANMDQVHCQIAEIEPQHKSQNRHLVIQTVLYGPEHGVNHGSKMEETGK